MWMLGPQHHVSHSGGFSCLTTADTVKIGTQFMFSNLVNIKKREILHDIKKKIFFIMKVDLHFKSVVWLMGAILPWEWSQVGERQSKDFYPKDWCHRN